MMKACNQCAHYFKGKAMFGNRCHRPIDEINPVTAEPYLLGARCRDERASSWWPWTDRCGPGAKYFEDVQPAWKHRDDG